MYTCIFILWMIIHIIKNSQIISEICRYLSSNWYIRQSRFSTQFFVEIICTHFLFYLLLLYCYRIHEKILREHLHKQFYFSNLWDHTTHTYFQQTIFRSIKHIFTTILIRWLWLMVFSSSSVSHVVLVVPGYFWHIFAAKTKNGRKYRLTANSPL